jgi:hypothetical protein
MRNQAGINPKYLEKSKSPHGSINIDLLLERLDRFNSTNHNPYMCNEGYLISFEIALKILTDDRYSDMFDLKEQAYWFLMEEFDMWENKEIA